MLLSAGGNTVQTQFQGIARPVVISTNLNYNYSTSSRRCKRGVWAFSMIQGASLPFPIEPELKTHFSESIAFFIFSFLVKIKPKYNASSLPTMMKEKERSILIIIWWAGRLWLGSFLSPHSETNPACSLLSCFHWITVRLYLWSSVGGLLVTTMNRL